MLVNCNMITVTGHHRVVKLTKFASPMFVLPSAGSGFRPPGRAPVRPVGPGSRPPDRAPVGSGFHLQFRHLCWQLAVSFCPYLLGVLCI